MSKYNVKNISFKKLSLVLSERIIYRLKRLQQSLRAAIDHSLSEVGLSGSQYAVLAALEMAPGASSADLARQCFVTAQTMNEIIQGLGENGLLSREEPIQGRVIRLYLTGDGRKHLEEGHRRVRAVEANALSALEPDERMLFLVCLDRCSSALEADRERTLRR